jgi:hypothetical protein
MLAVDVRQIRQPGATFVNKDEWIDLRVRHRTGGQGLQNGLAHDRIRRASSTRTASRPVVATCFFTLRWACAVFIVNLLRLLFQ